MVSIELQLINPSFFYQYLKAPCHGNQFCGKITYSRSLIALAFQHGMGYRYFTVRINDVNDASVSCKNFVNFGPVTPEKTAHLWTFCTTWQKNWHIKANISGYTGLIWNGRADCVFDWQDRTLTRLLSTTTSRWSRMQHITARGGRHGCWCPVTITRQCYWSGTCPTWPRLEATSSVPFGFTITLATAPCEVSCATITWFTYFHCQSPSNSELAVFQKLIIFGNFYSKWAHSCCWITSQAKLVIKELQFFPEIN